MNSTDTIPRMSEEEFRLIRDFLVAKVGLFFDEQMKFLLERRLYRRLELRQLKTYRAYEQFLRYDPMGPKELEDMVELLTTNETYFFRESYQLEALTEQILPEVIKQKRLRGDLRIKFWSAGCSSGEEPYTLAMMMLEYPGLAGWEIEIVGTDINQKVLAKARAGIYTEHSLRGVPPGRMDGYLERYADGRFRISDKVRKNVTFGAVNLLDRAKLSFLRDVDIILCRNVLIYFDPASKRNVVDLFHDKLNPGGFLLLGHSESLLNLSTRFMLRHFDKDMVYQKPVREKPV